MENEAAPESNSTSALTDGQVCSLLELARSQRAGFAAGLPEIAEIEGQLPGYSVTGWIGRGGMGAVYRGVQCSLDRAVAIKILPPDIDAADPGFALRFEQEAKAMASLTHPSIVAVHDAGVTEEGLPYFIMEYVDGGDLEQALVSRGKLPLTEALEIVEAVVEALVFAHEHGIVHRDIKPANILIDRAGRIKVADFGLARVDSAAVFATMTHRVMGSSGYLAPEAFLPDTIMDARADIFSVGAMLYQLLTGIMPRGHFDPPSSIVPGLDPRIDAIVARAMHNDREKRYPDARGMLADLKRVAGQPARRRMPGKLAALATAAVLLLAGGAIYWKAGREATPGGREASAPGIPSSASTPISWEQAFPVPARMPGLAEFKDGWALREATLNYTRILDSRGHGLPVRNGGIRARRQLPAGGFRAALLGVRHSRDAWPIHLHLAVPNQAGEECRLEIREDRFASLPADATAQERWAACVLLAVKSIPHPGEEVEVELTAVGRTVVGRLNGHTVTCQLDRDGISAGLYLLEASSIPFRDLEYVNLDGLPEDEARQAAGFP